MDLLSTRLTNIYNSVMSLIDIQPIQSNHSALNNSKLLDAICKTIDFAKLNNGIGLTKANAFNREFAYWAADNFDWPEYKSQKLLRVQKTLNEVDVPPAMVVHQIMMQMRLGRYVKGRFQLNKKALNISEDKGLFFNNLTELYLFQFDHKEMQRWPYTAMGNWDIFLNVISVEAKTGVTEAKLLDVLYGFDVHDFRIEGYLQHASFVLWSILKPLSWLGFLNENDLNDNGRATNTIYTKSELWDACFSLDTDMGHRYFNEN